MNVIVGISDAKVSRDPQKILVTYSLGSCIGMTLYDPMLKVGGMLHYQLPTSTLDASKAQANPMMFADTGFQYLLQKMLAMAGRKKKRLKVHLAGGAQILDDSGVFDIGRRNYAAARKLLWQQGMFIDGEDVGGNAPRNLNLSIADGSVVIKTTR